MEYRRYGRLNIYIFISVICAHLAFLSIKRLRYARSRKRLAAPGFARARRAVGGIACKPASALGPASAMRCIAATRLGNPLRGTWKSHGKRLEGSLYFQASNHHGTFPKISYPAERRASQSGEARKAPPGAGARRRWRAGNLFTVPPAGPRPKPSQTAPRPAGFPRSREAPSPAPSASPLLCFLCVENQPRTSPVVFLTQSRRGGRAAEFLLACGAFGEGGV